MNDDPGTTVEQTAPPRGRGRPPKQKPSIEGILANPTEAQIDSAIEAQIAVPIEVPLPLKIMDMPKIEPQSQAAEANHKLIGELRETLEPFAKLPCEPDAPPEKVLYKISRGSIEVDITNGNIIRAKTVLGIM